VSGMREINISLACLLSVITNAFRSALLNWNPARQRKMLLSAALAALLLSPVKAAAQISEIIDGTGDGVGNVLATPFDIAVDGSGNVYVAAEDSDNAFKITPGGTITEIIDVSGDGLGNQLINAKSIDSDANENVYVVGKDTDNAFKITPGGVITQIIDASGDGLGNPLNDPYGIAVDNSGNVYVEGTLSDNVFRIPPFAPTATPSATPTV